MTKQKISSKLVDARTLAIYALDHFIDYIRTLDPELKLDEATVLAAMALQNLPHEKKSYITITLVTIHSPQMISQPNRG